MNVTATEAKNRLGQVLEQAQREPVFVDKAGRRHSVVLSYERYEALLRAEAAESLVERRRRFNEQYKDWIEQQNRRVEQFGLWNEEFGPGDRAVAQYDVYANPSARLRDEYPYLVDLQSDLLSALDTRLVAPLAVSGAAVGGPPRRLSPVFNIEGRQVVMVPQETSAVLKRVLKSPVASLRTEHALLVDALDAVISGI